MRQAKTHRDLENMSHEELVEHVHLMDVIASRHVEDLDAQIYDLAETIHALREAVLDVERGLLTLNDLVWAAKDLEP